MSSWEVGVRRPQRWDVPFSEDMREVDVEHLLEIEPFCSMVESRFPHGLPLQGILQNDTRISRYQHGDIIVREGDYGHSAFMVLSGTVRVVLQSLDPDLLGRKQTEKRGLLQSLNQLWKNPKLPEVRAKLPGQFSPSAASNGAASNSATALGTRGDSANTRVFLQDVPRILENKNTVVLERGEIFGELSALSRTPRAATILADSDAVLLELRWQGLRDLMRYTVELRDHIHRLYRENSLRIHLLETPLLANLSPEQLQLIADATVFESHGTFEWTSHFQSAVERSPADAIVSEPLIVEEETTCGELLLVRSGFARLSHRHGHGHRTIAYLGKGQVFGLGELVESRLTGRQANYLHSLRALGYVDVLRIPGEVVLEQVLPLVPEDQINEVAVQHAVEKQEIQSAATPLESGGLDTGLLEFLVERRFLNGTQTMLVNMDRCTRCDDCIRACAATHDNNPRFLRHGYRHGPLMVANACMHCVDPICMIGCPTGAIGRDEATGVLQINDPTCIGCSTCANSCPFDNIRMVEIRDERGAVAIDMETSQPVIKATKCDLCVDQSTGPACQHACPHDALVRMDMGNLGELSAWIDR